MWMDRTPWCALDDAEDVDDDVDVDADVDSEDVADEDAGFTPEPKSLAVLEM